MSENIRPMSSLTGLWLQKSFISLHKTNFLSPAAKGWGEPHAEWVQWHWSRSAKFYLCGLKTGQSSPCQLQIPKPVTEHRNIYFTNTTLLIHYYITKKKGKNSLLSHAYLKILGAESTNMQHKEHSALLQQQKGNKNATGNSIRKTQLRMLRLEFIWG